MTLLHNKIITTNLSTHELSKLNRTTSQLYRILLKSIKSFCKNDKVTTKTSSNSTIHHDDQSTSTSISTSYLMLQPPLNPRDYGQARILNSSKCMIWSKHYDKGDNHSTTNDSTTTSTSSTFHDINTTKRILSFVHQWINYHPKNSHVLKSKQQQSSSYSRSHGYHDKKYESMVLLKMLLQDTQIIPEQSLMVSHLDLKCALQSTFHSFRLSSSSSSSPSPPSSHTNTTTNTDSNSKQKIIHLTKETITSLHKLAIDTFRLLDYQQRMWDRTSISIDTKRGVRIIATSTCTGFGIVTNPNSSVSSMSSLSLPMIHHRFAYRIRIENINPRSSLNYHTNFPMHTVVSNNDNDDDCNNTYKNSANDSLPVNIQLLGRTWNIIGDLLQPDEITQIPSNFFEDEEEDNEEDDDDDDDDESNQENGDYPDRIIHVDAPTTGAVGHLPVLTPGELFEYMSGCELRSKKGSMSGSFHFAFVGEGVESAQVGDDVEALREEVVMDVNGSSTSRRFQVKIEPFRLVAEEEDF